MHPRHGAIRHHDRGRQALKSPRRHIGGVKLPEATIDHGSRGLLALRGQPVPPIPWTPELHSNERSWHARNHEVDILVEHDLPIFVVNRLA